MRTLIIATLLLGGCRPDDVKDDTSDPGETGETADSDSSEDTETDTDLYVDITGGTWLSEGDNVSYLLQQYNFNSITAVFNTDGTYTVEAARSAGAPFTFTGTYTTDTSTMPATISIVQTSPTEDTATGIWQTSDETMYYEVLSGSASTCSAPTVEGGIGSTSCPGEDYPENFNVQTYVLQH